MFASFPFFDSPNRFPFLFLSFSHRIIPLFLHANNIWFIKVKFFLISIVPLLFPNSSSRKDQRSICSTSPIAISSPWLWNIKTLLWILNWLTICLSMLFVPFLWMYVVGWWIRWWIVLEIISECDWRVTQIHRRQWKQPSIERCFEWQFQSSDWVCVLWRTKEDWFQTQREVEFIHPFGWWGTRNVEGSHLSSIYTIIDDYQ